MSRSVAFIVPVLNEQDVIGGLLRQLRRRFPGSELVVVDGGSEDDTVSRAMPLCDRLLLAEAGRAAQMNLGARTADSEYLCFLHADCLPAVSAQQLQQYLASQPAWGFCRVRLSGSRRVFRLIEWFMNARSRLTAVATGDQMLFLRRELFEATGGFDEIPLMEDVAYSKRLRALATPCVVTQPVTTSSRRWEARGVVRTVLLMWSLRLAYVAGVPPQRLWQFYYGH